MAANMELDPLRAESALQSLDPHSSRDDWVRIGYAFAQAGGTSEAWHTWSAQSDKYKRADAEKVHRDGLRPGPVTAATLFRLALDAGWTYEHGTRPPLRAVPVERPAPPPEPPPVDPSPVWNDARPTTSGHAYLARKRVGVHGCRENSRGSLLVPYINEAGALQTVQAIGADGAKKFMHGTRYKGSVAVIGNPRGAPVVLLAEGFATAATLHEATGHACIIAGSIGQFPEAGRIARAWSPDADLVICADVGDMAKPFECSNAHGARVCTPGGPDARKGFDFNDWRNEGASIAEIVECIAQARPASCDSARTEPVDAPTIASPVTAIPEPPPEPDNAADEALASVTPIARKRKARPPAAPLDTSDPLQFTTKNGKTTAGMANVAVLLSSGQYGALRFDSFTDRILWNVRELDDPALLDLTFAVQRFYDGAEFPFALCGTNTVMDAIQRVAHSNAFNSARDWLDNLPKWDGVGRIAEFFVDVCNAQATDYARSVGVYFFCSMVARMMQPGARADAAVVLTGAQGVGKTSLLRTLAGERYGTASFHNIGEKDWCMKLRGKLIVEFSEFAGHSRTEMETIKSVLTETHDEYRAPYGRHIVAKPRCNVFAGTTNESAFLTDTTGNRRWLPIPCDYAIDTGLVETMREQYFAEAFAILTANPAFPYWLIADAHVEQAARVVRDPWVDLLPAKLADVTGAPRFVVATSWLMGDALGIPAERQTAAQARRLAACMEDLGYARARWKTGGVVSRGYVLRDSDAARTASKRTDGALYLESYYAPGG